MAEQLLKYQEVADRYRIHYTTLFDNVRKGKFPAPLKIGRASRWRLSDLEAWERLQMEVA